MSNLQETVTQAYKARFGEPPAFVVRAPGRVNLIGEHTDYNDGFVLPMAIDRAVWLAMGPRDDSRVDVISLNVDDPVEFDTADFDQAPGTWGNYVRGVTWALQSAGYTLNGWQGVMTSNVPVGSGLSSSAAIELAIARSFATVSEIDWHPAEMALLSQKAENEWLGLKTGIMDQMISASGVEGMALLIDCRDLSTQAAPLPPGTAVVVLDTGTRRGLVDSAYNERRAQCEAAAAKFGVSHLRDVTPEMFTAGEADLDPLTRQRARHVVTEDVRTLAALDAMHAGDATTLGQLMNQSHDSLRDDFEVSSEALDAMVNIARAQNGCFGARMTGAGFGGCAVALVEVGVAEAFAAAVDATYRTETGHDPQIYICQPTAGAALIR